MTKFKSYEEAKLRGFKVDQSSFNQLSLARDFDSWTVAHQLACTGELSEEYITNNVLKLSKNSGWTVAHELAYRDRLPERFHIPEILKLAKYSDGWSVAHELVVSYKLTEESMTEEILKLKSKNGWTVAHMLALRHKLPEKFMSYDILLLDSEDGYVYEHVPKYKELTLDSAKDDLDLYLLAMTIYNYPKISFDKFNELTNKYGLGKMKQLIELTGINSESIDW